MSSQVETRHSIMREEDLESIRSLLEREVIQSFSTAASRTSAVTEADLEPLPAAARRYLRSCGTVGRERVRSFRAQFAGRIRRDAVGKWRNVHSEQYNIADPLIGRWFYMRMSMFGIPVQGRDTYVNGKGRLLIRPFDRFTLQDWQGPEANVSELSTWLNDALLFAPSMLFYSNAVWRGQDDDSFEVSVSDAGNRASAVAYLGPEGEIADFRTEDRWMAGKTAVRATWSTPIDSWRSEAGRRFPAAGRATWLLPDGDFTYADFIMGPGSVELNPPQPKTS